MGRRSFCSAIYQNCNLIKAERHGPPADGIVGLLIGGVEAPLWLLRLLLES